MADEQVNTRQNYERPPARKARVEMTSEILQRRTTPQCWPHGSDSDPADPPPPVGTPTVVNRRKP